MIHILSDRQLEDIIQARITLADKEAHQMSARRFYNMLNETDDGSKRPVDTPSYVGEITENLFKKLKVYNRKILANKILCLCVKFGKNVTYQDTDSRGEIIKMNYENAVIFKERKTLGRRTLVGVCYSIENDRQFDKLRENTKMRHSTLREGYHPGLEYIASTEFLLGDEAEAITDVFDEKKMEQIIEWITEENA